jgi:general secretion pathway protein N
MGTGTKTNLTPFVALGIAAYLLFLLATMPASFVVGSAQEAEPGRFEATDVVGTAWSGSARVVLRTAGGALTLDRVSWHWLPASLLTARLSYRLEAIGKDIHAGAVASRTVSRWALSGLTAKVPASVLAYWLPAIAAARPEGAVLLSAREIESDGVETRGHAEIEWQGASVGLSDVKPLGTYRAQIASEGKVANVTLTSAKGPLRLSGKGTISPPAHLAFSGEARADAEAAKALEPLLNLLGPARADGARALEWRTP